SALDVLLDELWPVILSFAERGVGLLADAEDVAQEVFSKICFRISDFDKTRDGLSWAFGIASYEIMTHRKRTGRRREVHAQVALDRMAHDAVSQEAALVEREVVAAFEAAVGALTDADREVLGLVPQASALGPSSPVLRKRKQRALERLRRLWESIYGQP
ncbi:MAG TPA: sigma-70 family RNA polymerase sigma factor, partial [Polyangiaceae bacterium]|nr:sigma-70 family RNA polymerase sigma factor [Polyangiaceae bacterium]